MSIERAFCILQPRSFSWSVTLTNAKRPPKAKISDRRIDAPSLATCAKAASGFACAAFGCAVFHGLSL